MAESTHEGARFLSPWPTAAFIKPLIFAQPTGEKWRVPAASLPMFLMRNEACWLLCSFSWFRSFRHLSPGGGVSPQSSAGVCRRGCRPAPFAGSAEPGHAHPGHAHHATPWPAHPGHAHHRRAWPRPPRLQPGASQKNTCRLLHLIGFFGRVPCRLRKWLFVRHILFCM